MRDVVPWDNRFCYDLALGMDSPYDVCERYGVQPAMYEHWRQNPAFIKTVAEFEAEIRENGASFRTKAKIQAEDLLNVSYSIVHNSDTPAAVRADLIKWTAKVADLEPAPKRSGTTEGMTLDEAKRMLGDMDMVALEERVTRIVATRKGSEQPTQGQGRTVIDNATGMALTRFDVDE